jgi:ATP-dependent Clp protease adaptor protein ClpS
VTSGTREEIERHVEAMHGYGLQATMERADE